MTRTFVQTCTPVRGLLDDGAMSSRIVTVLTGIAMIASASAEASPERRINVASDVLGPLFDIYNVSASYALTDHVAIRADANHIGNNLGDYGIILTGVNRETYELGLSAPIYFRGAYRGLFVEPGAMVRERRSCLDANEPTRCERSPVAGPALFAGYHWMAASGFNVAVAVGTAYLPTLDVQAGTFYDHDWWPVYTMYLRFGYAF